MIVVSDTSPLSNLLMIGRLHVLSDLFNHVYVPDAVWQELEKLPQFGVDIAPLHAASWLTVQQPVNQALIEKLKRELDPGESEAIALALELQISTVLIDEKPGRIFAQQYDLTPTGVLGILLRAKSAGHVPLVKPELDTLIQKAKFYVSGTLRREILTLAGE